MNQEIDERREELNVSIDQARNLGEELQKVVVLFTEQLREKPKMWKCEQNNHKCVQNNLF